MDGCFAMRQEAHNSPRSSNHENRGLAPLKNVESHPAGKVAVFGGGIAGLTVAHELIQRGYAVDVYETNSEAGGFFRSARLKSNENMPSEYSWHGMGPWYHNLFDLLRQIPFDTDGSIYDRGLSRPIDFGIFPDHGEAQFYDHDIFRIPKMFAMSKWEWAKWSWVMFKTWSSKRRTERHYSTLNAAEQWKEVLGSRSYRLWRSCFGPWIGSDWTRVSLHTAGQFYRKQLLSKPRHQHPSDADGPGWTQGAGDGWLLLRGPSSEIWFDRWIHYLSTRGVEFIWNAALARLEFDGKTIASAALENGSTIEADYYVLATDPFSAARILARTPALELLPELRNFKPLIQDGPHTQVSFRIAFAEPIRFPRARTAVVLADTEFNLTLFAEEQVWRREIDLGEDVKSLWTGTSCVSSVPGRVYSLPVEFCTKEQFVEEIRTQILGCGSLDALVREANGERSLGSFTILRIEVWHEWEFSASGIKTLYPKWVNTTRNQAHLPRQVTPVSNLLLAGAHTKTAADVWSIEGAVESGRHAARGIDSGVQVLPQYKPTWLKTLSALDDLCFTLGLPHVLDLMLGASIAAMLAGMYYAFVAVKP